MSLGNCPVCGDVGQDDLPLEKYRPGEIVSCACGLECTAGAWVALCEQAAKARAWDDNRESASHFLTHGLREPKQLDATLAEERKKGGLE